MKKHPYRLLLRRFLLWLRHSFSFLWLAVVAGYLIVHAGQAVYGEYQDQQDTLHLKQQSAEASLEIERLQALLVYYHTDSFKEKELRRNLLLKKPGETVYALPESSTPRQVEEEIAASSGQATSNQAGQPPNLPIWRQWVQYVLRGDR